MFTKAIMEVRILLNQILPHQNVAACVDNGPIIGGPKSKFVESPAKLSEEQLQNFESFGYFISSLKT